MSIGTFTLIKDEARWIGPNIMRILPHVDEMVFFDGNSTDGTLEIIKYIQENNADGDKIILVEGADPKNLRESYVKMFNQCMNALKTDWAWFLHPDMWVENPGEIKKAGESDEIAQYTHLKSYGGDPGGKLYEIHGRGKCWKNIYRLRNPDLGAHYFGNYGAQNEDVYFSAITGDSHDHFGEDFGRYPYRVSDSGISVQHYSDVRPLARRLERMKRCLANQGYPEGYIDSIAEAHPRVTFTDGAGFAFKEVDWPEEFTRHDEIFSRIIDKAH
jgi:glycosyltransferase involved in cell wall biosynthesis